MRTTSFDGWPPAPGYRAWPEGVAKNAGELYDTNPNSEPVPVEILPQDAPPYLRSSRYCATDLLFDFA
jgi:hypothetical protein